MDEDDLSPWFTNPITSLGLAGHEFLYGREGEGAPSTRAAQKTDRLPGPKLTKEQVREQLKKIPDEEWSKAGGPVPPGGTAAVTPQTSGGSIAEGIPDWIRRNLPTTYDLWTRGDEATTTPAQMAPNPMSTSRGDTRGAPQPVPVVQEQAVDPWGAMRAGPGAPDPIEQLLQQLMNPTTANPAQDKADANASREMARTKLLAQLAFAGAVTKGAGPSWAGIGEGFTAAAGTYDKGFQRYQDALQESADRMTRQNEQTDNRRLAVSKARIDIDEAKRERERKSWQDTMDSLDKRFGAEAEMSKNDFAEPDSNVTADLMRRWELARQQGQYIPPTVDVSD